MQFDTLNVLNLTFVLSNFKYINLYINLNISSGRNNIDKQIIVDAMDLTMLNQESLIEISIFQ